MKNVIQKLAFVIVTISFLIIVSYAKAQTWQFTQPNGTDWVGSTTGPVTGVGIGNFAATNISAALHINTNLTAAQSGGGSFTADEVFRTQVANGTATNWRAFRNNTQMFRLNIPSNGNGVFLQSPQGDFNIGSGSTGTIIPSFQIRGGASGDAGNVSIGDYITLTSPQALLHLFKSSTVDFQMTNSNTGNTNTDGFRIVNDNSGRVTIYNWEDDEIAFGTGNAGGGGSLSCSLIYLKLFQTFTNV